MRFGFGLSTQKLISPPEESIPAPYTRSPFGVSMSPNSTVYQYRRESISIAPSSCALMPPRPYACM